MHYQKEIVHEPALFDKRHLSSVTINSPTFAAARIKQGGYGILDSDFWLQRIAKRGFHVIVLTLSGKGRYLLEDGTELIADAGKAFVSWSGGQGHHEETIGAEPWEMIWLTIWDDTHWFTPDCPDWEIIPFSNAETLRSLFLGILKEDVYLDRHSMQAMDLFERLFLIHLERSLDWTESTTTKYNRTRLVPLWELVTSHIGKEWPVELLCKEAGMSRPQLSRICQELYKKEPGEMVRELKMEHAKVLLCNTALTIAEVASEIGYGSAANFATAFLRDQGCTPGDYRKTQ